MSVSLPPEWEDKIKQRAFQEGLSVEGWLQQVFDREFEGHVPAAKSLQDELTPEEWIQQFHAWAEGHDRTTPLLSDEAISRENIYPDRL